MINAAEVERVRAIAYESRYKSGTLGVWARHWLALDEVMRFALNQRDVLAGQVRDLREKLDEVETFCIRNHG